MKAGIPAARYLTDQELQVRHKNYLDKAAESLIDSAELSDGLVYRFPLEDLTLQNLAEIFDRKRKGCPFF